MVFSAKARQAYLYWQGTEAKQSQRTKKLIKEIVREPSRGIGKPEPLWHAFPGYWSRRFDCEHRIVYKVVGDQLWIAQVRFLYSE